MFNVGSVLDSAKRHIVAIVVVAILAIALAVASSYMDAKNSVEEPTYRAETAVFMVLDGELDGSIAADETQNLAISDGRRIVMSNEIVSAVREAYGEDIQINSPLWTDEEKNVRVYTHCIFVKVSAGNAQTALDACNMAARLTAEKMEETMCVESATVLESAYLTNSAMNKVSSLGTEESVDSSSAANESQSFSFSLSDISIKKVIIYLFVALLIVICAFAAYDIIFRKICSAKDVERILGIPVLAKAKRGDSLACAAQKVQVLATKNDIHSVAVAGIVEEDGAMEVYEKLKSCGCENLSCAVSIIDSADALQQIAQSDGVLLVLYCGASKGKQIEEACKSLRIADVPVIGAIYLSK